MLEPGRTTLATVIGVVGLTLSGCGGGSAKPVPAGTTTGAGTTAAGGTGTTPAPIAGKKPKRTSLAATPAKTLTYSGTGPKELGVVRIPVKSTLEWTNDAPAAVRLFQIIPASAKVQSPVNSRDAAGRALIAKGAYHGFLVNADGKWTLKIVPGG